MRVQRKNNKADKHQKYLEELSKTRSEIRLRKAVGACNVLFSGRSAFSLLLLSVILITIMDNAGAQELFQTVKGRVVEAGTGLPLPGVSIVFSETDPMIGTTTGVEGYFRVEKVPPGRYNILFSFVGFETYVLREVLVGTGKETVLNIELKEAAFSLEEVVVRAGQNKKDPVNSMAIVSARQINMEEARRFAGGFDDPAHLAASFAGVADNMNSNGLVIRGNAPKGVLWRLEGLEISHPSHFANMTSFGGGGITALSAHMLDHSDFYTAAFPAEFGNALSGVFDLRLRTGNPDKREHTIQAGLLGIDVASEGPFRKGCSSTYLVNYRYSLFALMEPILPENAGRIRYQNLSFKTQFPAKKAGIFSVWGLGANDYSGQRSEKDPAKWEYEDDALESDGRTAMGAVGLTHKILSGSKTLLSSSVAFSGDKINLESNRFDLVHGFMAESNIDNKMWKVSFSSFLHHKFNVRHTNRTGITLHSLGYDMHISTSEKNAGSLSMIASENGNALLLQGYSQSVYDLSESLTLTAGMHMQYFGFTGHHTIEPRAGLQWRMGSDRTFRLGYGAHSRLEMIALYMARMPTVYGYTEPNRKLDFSKAHHLVAGYDVSLSENVQLRCELFYQRLYSIPVRPDHPFSMLNVDQDWFIRDSLVNKGSGRNFGIDITAEKFMSNGWYYLATASIFEATYTGGDRIRRNSRYNKNYVCGMLIGKEWNVGKRGRNNAIGINGKLSLMGGDFMSPVDEAATLAAQDIIYDETKPFTVRKPDVTYLHLTVNFRKNRQNRAEIISFQLLNILGSPEFFGYKFHLKRHSIDKDQQVIVLPNITWKIEF